MDKQSEIQVYFTKGEKKSKKVNAGITCVVNVAEG